MEKLKAARKPLRGLITKTCNEVEDLLRGEHLDEVQILAKDGKLVELSEKILEWDQKILDLYLDENNEKAYEEEIVAIDNYNSEIRTTKIKLNREFRKLEKEQNPTNSYAPSEHSTITNDRPKRKFKLPKIELLKFSGKLIDWLSWWSQFKKIHDDDELHITDKFEYLRQAMVPNTRAKEIVDGYPATEDNYPKVIQALRDRFGKKKLLIQVYVRELFQMGLQNLNKKIEITSIFDKLVSHVRSLESLGVTIEQAALFLYPMVESSLPDETLIAWQRSPLYEKDGSLENPPKNELDYLFQFLHQEVERDEQRQLVKVTLSESSGYTNKSNERKGKNQPIAAGLFNGQVKSLSCIFCNKSHESKDCATTEFWSIEDMRKKIQENKACFYCLKQNHTVRSCKTFVKCHVCSKRHFTILCPEIKEKKMNKNATGSGTNSSANTLSSIAQNSSAGTNFDCCQDVLMKTIMVYVVINSRKMLARLLFDDGSQRSYATCRLMQSIGSKPFKQECMRNILFDGTKTEYQKFNNHKVDIESLNGKGRISIILRERPVLGGRISRIPKGHWLDEFKNKGITFNDVSNGKDSVAVIDLVIGSDYWGTIMKGSKESLPCGLSAFESIWGWTLSGPIPQDNQTNNYISMFMAEEDISNLWSLELIGIRDPIEKLSQQQEEQIVMEMFRKGLQRNTDGRYKVNLPWMDEVPKITHNKKVATSRLMSATKKLNMNNQFKTYDDIIKSWVAFGFIEKAENGNNEKGHYLPHRPVFKDSVTTPVRPVFDASCKTYLNLSLNDCMYKGPNFIESLPEKLIRFRMKWVGLLSDIWKAFQMIDVMEKDREYLQFLWWEDDTQTKIVVWRHCRVVFGLKCSPFLLAAVLEEHLSNVKGSKEKAAVELKKALYIDNCVTSVNSYEEYEEFKKTSVEIMSEGKFDLRQWECASPAGRIEGPMETKVLGMIWEKGADTMKIQVPKLVEMEKLTKRNIASVLHKFFDPLGIISPALMLPKIMLQLSWKKKSSWDEELPDAWKVQFKKWCSEAALLNEIKIPRLCSIPNSSVYQLHTFTDASQGAYSTVVFLRSEHEGEVKIQMIQSKSRVAPISQATINRLELMGCLIGSRLAQHTLKAMEIENVKRYFWCDSTTAIAWIKRNSQWGTFVHNRVKRIRQVTELDEWRYVPGKLNPADLPSRGCNPGELLHSKWWEGPSWLQLSIDKWPNHQGKYNEEEINKELKKDGSSTSSMFSVDAEGWFDVKFSKFSTKIRVMAWILRFCHNIKNKNAKKIHDHLTIPELRDAEVAIVRIIQQEVEISAKEGKQIQKCMAPTTITDNGVLRLKTPITKRMDTEGFRYPYLLPSKHPLVRDLIMETHIHYCHAGAQFIMSKLREKYWITQSRKTISSVIQRCIKCQRFHSRRMDTIPAALPETRVKSGEAFDSTGVDLFGPFVLKNGSKVWAVLYTCAVYRGIYLDIIKSIDVKTFVKSLKKFIFRYGRPLDLLSDNGTNFTGTANLLRSINVEMLLKECEVEKIRWNFNPPAAPWWGGFYERLVRSVKEPLRKVLGQASINMEQLELLLLEITNVINDRPLTTLTEDPEDLEPLTPNMFLRGTKNATFPEEQVIVGKTLQKEWERIQEYKVLLQSRFRKEYIGQLVEHKRTNQSSQINVGDIVLVEIDKKKRYQWPMGRVLEIMPSSDGEVRVATIKTKTGCFNRPLRRLYPLEMSQSNSKPIISNGDPKIQTMSNEIESNDSANETGDEREEFNYEKKTRSGRKVKKPIRYTSWNK